MRDKLRRRYQVHKEVSRSGTYEGEIALADMDRLQGLICSLDGGGPDADKPRRNIAVSFEFARNEYDLPTLKGRVATRLELVCQRCLGAMEISLETDFQLLIDATDDVLRHSSLDSLYSDEGCIDIFDVVEDELILAIPLVALHEDRGCNQHWQDSDDDAETAARDNPFAVLRDLKTAD